MFTEDFESAPAFTLNTADAGSTLSAWNTWVVNSSYTGGDGDVICIGFPFPYTIVNTAGQPAGITSPNGNYLHTASVEGINDGITCCSFGAADGFCITADNTFSRMSNDVSTVGYSTVDLKFWWLCAGGPSNYGQLYYSINGGVDWTLLNTPLAQYSNQSSWVEQTVTNAAFGDQSTLRFGFRFVNAVGSGALDPGFGIDDVRIMASSTSSIATAVSPLDYCQGSSLSVPYTIVGTFNAGNVFTAQLSDAVGSFAAPVIIGQVTSTLAGSIPCVIPMSTTAGNGYRIRVVASAPATTGADNGSDIIIGAFPNAGSDVSSVQCIGTTLDLNDLLSGADAGGSWSGGTNLINVTSTTAYLYVVSNTCGSDTAMIHVNVDPIPDAGNDTLVHICKNTGDYQLFDLLGGTPQTGGTWTGPDNLPTDPVFDSFTDLNGTYAYTIAGGCGGADAVVSVVLGEPGNAGPDAEWFFCSTEVPIDLSAQLVGANTNGVWYQNGAPIIGGIVSDGGAFTYVDYAIVPCPNDTARINITIVPAVDAGENTTVTICTYWPLQQLVTLINGTPDPGGVWTDPNGQPFGGTFNPLVSAQGLYTYTVIGTPPCPSDQSSIAVVVQTCVGVEEVHQQDLPVAWIGADEQGGISFSVPFLAGMDVQVIDARGSVVLAQHVITSDGHLRLLTDTIPPGAYALRVIARASMGVARFIIAR